MRRHRWAVAGRARGGRDTLTVSWRAEPERPPVANEPMTAPSNHLTPSATVVHSGATGWGAVAVAPIAPGELVAVFGGEPCTLAGLRTLGHERRARSIQIDDDLYLAGPPEREPGDAINHCCRPNCGPHGASRIVALREIDVGEVLTFDYGTTDGSTYDEFECRCGTPSCRGVVRGTDWRREDLRARHGRGFSPYIARRMRSWSAGRALTKADVEGMFSTTRDHPVEGIRRALSAALARPHATFGELLAAVSLPGGLSDGERSDLLADRDHALDSMIARLNEERARDLRAAFAPIPR